MSYCRWGDCDVYVYEHVDGGWVTHVASCRRVGGFPPPYDSSSLEAWKNSIKARDEWFVAHREMVEINLPHAGQTFVDETPGECAGRLEWLRSLGYIVPDHAIAELREEHEMGEK